MGNGFDTSSCLDPRTGIIVPTHILLMIIPSMGKSSKENKHIKYLR